MQVQEHNNAMQHNNTSKRTFTTFEPHKKGGKKLESQLVRKECQAWKLVLRL